MNGFRTDMKPGHTSGREESALRLSVPFSEQSIPLRRTRSGWVLCRTSMVSPSSSAYSSSMWILFPETSLY